MAWQRMSIHWLVAGVALVACAAPQRADQAGSQGAQPAPGAAQPKRVTAAIMGDPPALATALAGFGIRGVDAIEHLLNAGLTIVDNRGTLQPRLAEAVPSLDAGSWTLLPDGMMETTWRIRHGALWHDGAVVTADDFLFRARLAQDRELPLFTNAAYALTDAIEAPDPSTIKVRWKQPYIDADALFNDPPAPKHLLERPYLGNKAGFPGLAYWTEEFSGTGPYRLRELVRGSHLVLDANDRYVLGRPRIDIVEIRFIPDPTTIVANILAGEVELTLGKTLSAEQAVEVANQWPGGKLEFTPSNAVSVYPQLLTPNPPIVSNPAFRRALLHAVDRQQLVDALLLGRSSIAHSFLFPGQAQYQAIEARLSRYDYDPRRAAQMLEALGYSRAGDGMFRDSAGQPLSVELRTYTVDVNQKATLTVADFWQRVGVAVTPNVMSPQAAQNNEYVFTYPAFILQRYTSDVGGLRNLHSSRTPLPENNFRSGNVSRYVNAEFDALLDRYFSTIPLNERTEVLGQIIFHIADQLTQMGLFFDAEPTVLSGRLQNVAARWPSSTQAWNAHQWGRNDG